MEHMYIFLGVSSNIINRRIWRHCTDVQIPSEMHLDSSEKRQASSLPEAEKHVL